MRKVISLILIIICIFNAIALTASADEGKNWYVKRSGHSQPEICREHQVIEKYDCYYIDKKLNDNSSEKRIYLTFDAGYENGNVEKILNILKEKNVPAAFFLLDHIIIKNTDIVMRMTDEGHLVCNHTKNHKDMSKLSDDEIKNNLTDLEKIYEQKTGKTLAKYFRFPEGRYSEQALKTVNDMGYKIIFWSFGYADWDDARQPSADRAYEKVIENTHNGEVVLLYPTSKTNVEILPRLIDEWRNMGYTFGTLDELTV